MPRILPRLLKALEKASLEPHHATPVNPVIRKKRKTSVPREATSFRWTEHGRIQSVLAGANPFVHKHLFRRRKALAPRVTLGAVNGEVNTSEDRPKEMTEEEKGWYASPYLRMLSTPLRRCALTNRKLPRDFLIRMAPVQVSGPRSMQPKQYFMPSGIEHPRFKSHKSRRGVYMVCLNSAVDRLRDWPGAYKRYGHQVELYSNLKAQISHLLRVRILQEAELLADRLSCNPRGATTWPLLRRLTRAEYKEIKNTNTIPYPSAVAVLVVPPLNKDPTTGRRPEPNSTSFPDSPELSLIPKRPSLPLSQLLPVATGENHGFPLSRIPLYNGITLFPSRCQRAALHSALNRLLYIERRSRHKMQHIEKTQGDKLQDSPHDAYGKPSRGDHKASHAYLLCSDAQTLPRTDAVPLAIALWRLRMWEDDHREELTNVSRTPAVKRVPRSKV